MFVIFLQRFFRIWTKLSYFQFWTSAFRWECSQRTNWLSTNRPSFPAGNKVVTLTRVTNERVAYLGRHVAGQFSSVHALWTSYRWVTPWRKPGHWQNRPDVVSWWLGSRVVSVLDSGAEGPGFRSHSRRCRITVLGKLLTPIVPLFTKQRNIGSSPLKGCEGNCRPGGK